MVESKRRFNPVTATVLPSVTAGLYLFRFWIAAASKFPGATARALARATTPAAYREALAKLADEQDVNLPPPMWGGDR